MFWNSPPPRQKIKALKDKLAARAAIDEYIIPISALFYLCLCSYLYSNEVAHFSPLAATALAISWLWFTGERQLIHSFQSRGLPYDIDAVGVATRSSHLRRILLF